MSSYSFLAGCYDRLTYDVDYAAWADPSPGSWPCGGMR